MTTQLTYDVTILTAPAAVTTSINTAPGTWVVPEIETLTAPTAPGVTRSNPSLYVTPEIKMLTAPTVPGITRSKPNLYVTPEIRVLVNPCDVSTRPSDGVAWPTGSSRFGYG